MALTARDIMTTEVLTVTPSTSLADFARMCSEDGISGAPVVHVDGTLVGIVSKTDLITKMIEDDPKYGTSDEAPAWSDSARQVNDIMQTDVLTVEPDAPIADIATGMAERRIHRVVVMEHDEVVGLVTSLDLLRHWGS